MTTKLKVPPQFHNRQEEADFWDTHNITDYAESLKPVTKIKYELNSESITVRFRPTDLANLRKIASKRGIGVTTLSRMWLIERLNTKP